MLNVALQFICCFLLAVGLLFIVVELRTNYDRSHLFFGLSLVMMCLMAAVDIWLTPAARTVKEVLYWQRMFHVMSCVFLTFSIWYLMLLTRRLNMTVLRAVILVSMVMSVLIFTDLMMTVRDGDYAVTGLYRLLYVPYALLCVIAFNAINVQGILAAKGTLRRILVLHQVGIALVCVLGIADIVVVSEVGVGVLPIANFAIVGAFAFGIMASAIFTERFLGLLRERDETLSRLGDAYRELEETASLKQLGESTAIINHEIRNMMGSITGNAQLLEMKEQLSEAGKRRVRSIFSTGMRIADFSQDILGISKSRVVRDKRPVCLYRLVESCIERHFENRRESFDYSTMDRELSVYGDWGKLEQVLLNLFKNSFEAASDEPMLIRVGTVTGPSAALLTIEDNGAGCDADALGKMFKAFFTTKSERRGSGLGMSLCRSIVEGHGGRISAYSKNVRGDGSHGVKFQLAFPRYAADEDASKDSKQPVVLVKDGIDNLQHVIRILQNVHVNPYVVQTVEEVRQDRFSPEEISIVASAATINRLSGRQPAYRHLHLLSSSESILYSLDLSQGHSSSPEVFSEEYVLSRLLPEQTAPWDM